MTNNFLLKILAIVCFILVIRDSVLAQQTTGAVGSKLPELKINGTYLNGNDKSSISDLYKKGGLIINFWATWCTPCIKEQKILDSLTKIYQDLSVITTTYEDSSIVKRHFAKVGLPKSKSIIVITNETVLHSFFKHRLIPHNIWISKEGIIRASTGGDDINEKNIREFLKGSTSNLYTKNDDLKFDQRKTYHVSDSLILFRSYITGFNENITSGLLYGPDKNEEFKRIFEWNRPIIQFFWLAYTNQQNYKVNWSLVDLKTSDSVRFYQPSMNRSLFERSRYNNGESFSVRERKWNSENLFCYELILPQKIKVNQSSDYMFPDLERFFSIKATIEKRKILTHVISLDKSKLIKLPAQNEESASILLSDGNLLVKGVSIDRLLHFLSENFDDNIPYVNETGYGGKISFVIKGEGDKVTLEEIWDSLKQFGFQKNEKKRSYPILVIKDLAHP